MSARSFCSHATASLLLAAAAILAHPATAHAGFDECVTSASAFNAALKEADDDEVTIRVVQGTYSLTSFQQPRDGDRFNRNIHIIGGYAAYPCDTQGTVDPQYTVFDGTGAGGSGGIGISSSANVTIESVTLRNYPHGLNFYLYDAITDTTLTLNRVVLDHLCPSGDCGAGNNPFFVQHPDYLVLSQVIVANNPSGACAFNLRTSSLNEAQVVNSVFASNGGSGLCLVDGFGNTGWTLQAYNNLFWGNGGSDLYTRDSNDIHLVDNIYHTTNMSPAPATAASGTLDADPQFKDPAADNFSIHLASPAVNTGTANVPGILPALDISGFTRLIGSHPDRGAYETIMDDTLAITVNSTSGGNGTCPSAGNCTLRTAITNANSAGGFHHIYFDIPGTGCEQHIVALTSALPSITSTLTIDGYSQPGSAQNTSKFGTNAVICVGVEGGYAADYALQTSGSGVLTVDGIGFGSFNVAAIGLPSGDGNKIWGNQFGGSVGTTAIGNQPANIAISGSAQHATIGGYDVAQMNVIGSASGHGIELLGSGSHTVAGNLIGASRSGNSVNGNQTGIYIAAGNNSIFNNVISGNFEDGVLLDTSAATGNWIAQNRIGRKGGIVLCLPPAACNYALPNLRHGIRIQGGAHDNLMSNDTIAYNGVMGVSIGSGRGNNVAYASIFANAQYGIDLDGSGLNDDDGDPAALSLPNRGLNYPVLQNAYGSPHTAWLDGYLTTTNGSYTISIYASPSCDNTGYGEGQNYIALDSVTISNATPGFNGFAVFHIPFKSPSIDLTSHSISALATSSSGDVSEFSPCKAYNCDVIFRHGFDSAAGESCPAP